MPLLLGFLFSLILMMPSDLWAKSCECSPIPAAGEYFLGQADDTFTLTYQNGDENNCPTKIGFKARPGGAAHMEVDLTCQGGVWTGSGDPGLGPITWVIWGEPKENPLPDSTASDEHYQINTFVSEVNVQLWLSDFLLSIPKLNREGTASFQGPGAAKAPACICSEVKKQIGIAKSYIEGYEDQNLLRIAKKDHLRGDTIGANYWMDDNRQLHKFLPSEKNYSYDDFVKGRDGEDSSEDSQRPLSSGKEDENPEVAVASTDPLTCKVNPPDLEENRKNCTPAIVMQAWVEHEDVHRATCLALNSDNTATRPDGIRVKLGETPDALSKYPARPFIAWSQHPPNQSADEILAYQREVNTLSEFFLLHCQ